MRRKAHQSTDASGKRVSRRSKIVGIAVGVVLASAGAYAATSWVVGLNAGSAGESQSATVNNLTITAYAGTPTNTLYPGGNGDAMITISNPNSFPVTITAVQLPTSSTYATGYQDSGLGTPQSGCTSSNSAVSWNYATGSSGSSHTLTTPITVAASGQSGNPLNVILTNDATMGTGSPAACEATYFQMPSFTGVTASGGAATANTGTVTDGWTS